ncbi:MAG: KH domain-containing protein [bacterium]
MNDQNSNIQDFVEYIVKSIVKNPNDVIIEQNMNSYDETYIIHVNNEDMGVVIGKSGKNINAIRNLVSIKSSPKRIYIQISETQE